MTLSRAKSDEFIAFTRYYLGPFIKFVRITDPDFDQHEMNEDIFWNKVEKAQLMGVVQVPQNPYLKNYQGLLDVLKNWILSNHGLLRTRNHFHIPDRVSPELKTRVRSRNQDLRVTMSLDRPDVHRMQGKDQNFI